MSKNELRFPPEIEKELQKFEPYWYQNELIDAIENKGYRKLMCVWSRRAGKDLACFQVLYRAALRRRGNYLYMLPTQKQARKVIFQGLTLDGTPFLDYIPTALIAKKLDNEMFIRLINGSQIYFCGSNSFDSYRGISPMGVVFSEGAYSHPLAYSTISPALLFNDGFSIHISTPFGENFFYDLFKAAEQSPSWFVQYLPFDKTGHITQEQIDQEIKDGTISPHMAEQEYNCRWDVGSEGSYFAKYVNELVLNDQITDVVWDRAHPVWTFFDLGIDDHTAIIFAQFIGPKIHIIDFYMDKNLSTEHYIQYVLKKPYLYAGHVWPHDGEHRQKMTGQKLSDMAWDLGLKTQQATRVGFQAGIEKVRQTFNKFWIDETKCRKLITCMRDYRKEYNTLTGKYSEKPYKDYTTDACDALRYLCVTYESLTTGMSADEAKALRRKAFYGTQHEFPKQLREQPKMRR